MNLQFPITIEKLDFSIVDLETISNPRFSCSYMQINEDDFYLKVNEVANYRVQKGNIIKIFPHKNSDIASIKLFLNGSVLGAILHQRATLPFHGSCFEYDQKGIMICGVSGAGKSSVTAAFCKNGAQFINDDITPVEITDESTTIIPIKTKIKLWDDSLAKLDIVTNDLEKIRPSLEKFYLPVEKDFKKQQTLHHIFVLSTHTKNDFESFELEGMAKFNTLRKQIYRKIYLKGMPETEKKYFKQLFLLVKNVRVTRIVRPQLAEISTTMEYIKQQLEE
ncbi:hypothetical protein [Flavobacterium sp. GSA192]|uniref:hypothetical protein n=1 Tax=Flavobacterium sp. GSA192 TaxID=2576304 RepID=UPI0011286C8A|nr:hypothetical protein [Flavobacterium sp. GSA192]